MVFGQLQRRRSEHHRHRTPASVTLGATGTCSVHDVLVNDLVHVAVVVDPIHQRPRTRLLPPGEPSSETVPYRHLDRRGPSPNPPAGNPTCRRSPALTARHRDPGTITPPVTRRRVTPGFPGDRGLHDIAANSTVNVAVVSSATPLQRVHPGDIITGHPTPAGSNSPSPPPADTRRVGPGGGSAAS